jgi:hypothetical protein
MELHRLTTTLLFCCLGWIINLSAQAPTLGLIAGINLSTITGTDASPRNQLFLAPHLGAYADWELGPSTGFQPGILLYSRKGTNNGNSKFREDYFELPLLLRYSAKKNIDLLVGPQLSFLYSARVNDPRGDITASIRDIDFSLVFGARYHLDPEWNVGLRFVPGLARILEDGSQRRYNFVIQFSLGYILN